MDKVKIGIPRSIYYYYFGDLWFDFFKKLKCEVIISPKTNKEIMDLGIKYATDEMCVSMKNYLGHVAYLKDKCDYILVPRIDNYGIDNQTCTNFLATYDIINNLFDKQILNYNVCLTNNETEKDGLVKLGIQLGFNKEFVKRVYDEAKEYFEQQSERKIRKNMTKLKSDKTKVLIVGHPYNVHDDYIGKPIINYLLKQDIELIYSDLFNSNMTNKVSRALSNELYFKYNKENIGSIYLAQNMIDGIIFLTSFPCGPDSLVNELVMRKIKLPYLNLIVDDMDSMTGLETRLESFLDILERRSIHE